MSSAARVDHAGGEKSRTPHHQLQEIVNHAAHLLPQQGPIGVFIHHNTLHAFQHLPFEEAVIEASRRYGTEPFMSEAQFQAERIRGRILDEDIDFALALEPDNDLWPKTLTRRALRRLILTNGVRYFSPQTIAWQIEEEGLLDHLREDLDETTRRNLLENSSEETAARQLFAVCYRRLIASETAEPSRPARPQTALLSRFGVDIDDAIHPLLIRLCANFLDQGLAYWSMPGREHGFYAAVRELFKRSFSLEHDLLKGLSRRFAGQTGSTAADIVLHHLKTINVEEPDWESFLTAELLALPGWAGLMRRLEEEPELAPHKRLPSSLMDYLAVRLTMVVTASENLWKRQSARGSIWTSWRRPMGEFDVVQDSHEAEARHMAEVAQLFDLAQLLGLSGGQLNRLSDEEFNRLVHEMRSFHDFERRRVFQLAYEHRHERLNLGPIDLHRRELDPRRTPARPVAQVFFCIDEREESIRRALEEIEPDVETFGAAGFFGVAVHFQGLDDAHGVALCPVVVKPKHAVREKAVDEDATHHQRRQTRRKLWARISHGSFVGSRTLVRAWAGATGLGALSLFPLVSRTIAPLATGRLSAWFSERLLPDPRTSLTLVRNDDAEPVHGFLPGFSIQEKADRVAGVLRPAGLVKNMSRIVVVLGHGSTSLNNPHESAHDCGACGGRRGGPNGRLFAAMANHPEVRLRLKEMGIEIPDDAWFVGGYHDTCNDDVTLFDLAAIPSTHLKDFAHIKQSLDRARAASALERARRFEAAWKASDPQSGLRHVQERSEHLAEPRPEYGHATNAVAIVGRRALTRGLFLDRRSFLVSYDPDIDASGDSLAALLAAGGPVCAGINLEYYFSFVDNERYGCGTKLPHNVTGLVGVMNGHASDLRTGLPWQMVEVHEPVRLLLLVEAPVERLLDAVKRSPVVTELVQNRWIRPAAIDPETGRITIYRNGEFVPFISQEQPVPEASSSFDWYNGKLEHLPIAKIRRHKEEAA